MVSGTVGRQPMHYLASIIQTIGPYYGPFMWNLYIRELEGTMILRTSQGFLRRIRGQLAFAATPYCRDSRNYQYYGPMLLNIAVASYTLDMPQNCLGHYST